MLQFSLAIYFILSTVLKLSQEREYMHAAARKHRKVIRKDLLYQEMKREEFDERATEEIPSIPKWIRRKDIMFLSNFHNSIDVTSLGRKMKDDIFKQFSCHDIVKEYNAYMGSVNKSNMLKHCYEINLKFKNGGTESFIILLILSLSTLIFYLLNMHIVSI